MAHTPRLASWLRLVLGTTLVAAVLPAGALTVSKQPSADPGWQDEIVDAPGLVGYASSIALDSSGYPHIAYYDFTGHSLKYAAWDGVVWNIDTVDDQLGAIDTIPGGYPLRTAIAFSAGAATIVYQSYDEASQKSYLQLAEGSPGGWTLSQIVSVPYAYAPTLKIDPTGALHVSYSLSDPHDPWGGGQAWQSVVYASRAGPNAGWLTQGVDQVHKLGGLITSLALDTNNHPLLAYGDPYALGSSPVLYAHLAASAWQTQTVAADGDGPSLAADLAGNPHIAYVAASGLKYASWSGVAWQSTLADSVSGQQSPTLAFDGANHPSIAYLVADAMVDSDYVYLATFDGATWHSNFQNSPAAQQPAFAVDAAGVPHISYLDNSFQDLHQLVWGPAWITQTVAAAGDEARLAVDLNRRPFIAYSTVSPSFDYRIQLAHWTASGDWQYRTALPFNAKNPALQMAFDANRQPVPIISYVNLEGNPHLGFARLGSGGLVSETVDGAADVGWSSSLSFDHQLNPIIGYVDLNNGGPARIKYAASPDHGQSWAVITDTAAPPLGPFSGVWALSAGGSIICCNTYVAYLDRASQALRLATWDGAHWTDERVDGGNGDAAGYFVSLAVDQGTGKPAMAYYDATHAEVRYAFWQAGWVTHTVDSGLKNVSDVSLALMLGSDQYPHIAYTASVDKSLRLAWSYDPTSPWAVETVAQFATDPNATFPAMRLASLALDRDLIAWSAPATGVVYAFSAATLPYSLYYNPLQPCLDQGLSSTSSLGQTLARVRALAASALSQVDDLTTLRALRDLFALSPAGRHYINLYYQYAPETGALALANPGLLWDAYRTLQNFVPGFLALDRGQGDGIMITQAMVDQANNIADRLVAAGSPALGAAINTERAKFNHLQAFAGKTVAQAAVLMGVNTYQVDLPVFQR